MLLEKTSSFSTEILDIILYPFNLVKLLTVSNHRYRDGVLAVPYYISFYYSKSLDINYVLM